MKFFGRLLIFLIIAFGLAFFVWQGKLSSSPNNQPDQEPEEIETTYTKQLEITEGSTYGKKLTSSSN